MNQPREVSPAPAPAKVQTAFTLARCRSIMAFSVLMILFSATFIFFTPMVLARVAHGTFIAAHCFALFTMARAYKRIQKDGPIVPAPSDAVAMSALQRRFLSGAGFALVSLLTILAVLWTATSICLAIAVPGWISIFAAVLTDMGLWWFTSNCWKRLYREQEQAKACVALAQAQIAADDRALSAAANTAVRPVATHWWTDNSSRDEIQGLGRS